MLPVVTAQEMRSLDQLTIETYGIPGIVLMERAGQTVAQWILRILAEQRRSHPRALVVCGKGNNGGDGFVIARHLHEAGVTVEILLWAPADAVKGDARTNLDVVRQLNIPLYEVPDEQTPLPPLSATYDVVVDALLGTGFRGELRGLMKKAVDHLKSWYETSFIVAVDIPSGQSSDQTLASADGVFAHLTVTMGALKYAHAVKPASATAGTVKIADIGIPQKELAKISVGVVEPSDVTLPPMDTMRNKYTAGKVGVIAGSPGFTGAAAMAAEGALRMGAGLVRLAIPQSLNPILEQKLTEVITVPLPESNHHTITPDSLPVLEELLEWSDVLIIGPGLGRSPEVQEVILTVLQKATQPVIIDADALFALAENPAVFNQHGNGQWILTPHDGEFRRFLANVSREDLLTNRIQHLKTFVSKWGVNVVLKSATTISATANGELFINPTGNPALASGGTGDVLAGLLGGYLAQVRSRGGEGIRQTLISVPFIHGYVADWLTRQQVPHTITATDLLRHLGEALSEWQEDQARGALTSPYVSERL